MRRRRIGVRETLFISLLICLTLSTCFINPVSGSIFEGKTSYFLYYQCEGDWYTNMKISVEDWNSIEEIATIRFTNRSSTQGYRLKIPEWTIVGTDGDIVGRGPYCPIWLDVSEFDEGFVFNNTNHWLYNFTVELASSDHCEIRRTTPHAGYEIIESLYYDPVEERIEQFDTSIKYPDNTVHTVRLLYYDGVLNFPSTSTTQGPTDSTLTVTLILGVMIELAVIIYFLKRRFGE